MTKLEQFKRIYPVVDYSVRQLCTQPYGLNDVTGRFSHPNGCPNYGKKVGCPPDTPSIEALIDVSKSVWAIWNIFDFATHCQKLRDKHPKWSKRQIECCLYWQGTARKQLKINIAAFLKQHRGYRIISNPEGAGVNVTATMVSIGHKLQWPPITKTYQVALAGERL